MPSTAWNAATRWPGEVMVSRWSVFVPVVRACRVLLDGHLVHDEFDGSGRVEQRLLEGGEPDGAEHGQTRTEHPAPR
jgi:hypothetical protein